MSDGRPHRAYEVRHSEILTGPRVKFMIFTIQSLIDEPQVVKKFYVISNIYLGKVDLLKITVS